MLKKFTFYPGILFLLIFSACKNGSQVETSLTVSETHEVTGVSVWDKIAARSQARRNSDRASLLSLGESFIYLDTFAIDSSSDNTKFLKVRLSDSSEVWVYDFASVLEAKPAVITSEVPLYLRPDLLTITDTRMTTMEIIAVLEEWDDWIKIVNEKKENTGWIKKEYITYNTIDLAFALLVKRNMEEKDSELMLQNLEDLLKNNPYPNTIFITDLRDLMEHEKELQRERDLERDREKKDQKDKKR